MAVHVAALLPGLREPLIKKGIIMIQDIFPKKLDNAYSSKTDINNESIVFVYNEGKFLLKIDEIAGTIEVPRLKDFKEAPKLTYLFKIDDESFFYTNASHNTEIEGFEFHNMRHLRNFYLDPKHYVFASYTAIQLIEWYENNRFCGHCGSPMEHSKTERALICPNCKNIVYPRINPAVIVGVTNKDTLLLTKYRTGFAHNALVAGFTEIGETLEETVKREVMEETGLHVKNIRYYKSQPWGIASDILMGFFCDVDGDDTITMDDTELKYAEWVQRDDIVLQPLEYSLTNEMMKLFKSGASI